jgi:hypothetical protein
MSKKHRINTYDNKAKALAISEAAHPTLSEGGPETKAKGKFINKPKNPNRFKNKKK